ncbi:MAG: hypothetical protein AWM53_02013 [Candidatus Dichloromethanomonas elyunquensis]|nr:MAG: hypothetical protein AWM53_02013 [Candidatus Dichloromethanomonas elyunquensis]
MADGWIKLHRKVLESKTFSKLTAIQKLIAIYIILNANHEDGEWHDSYKNIKVPVKRGQLITSRNKIKEWFNYDKEITDQKIRTTLNKLTGEFLTIETTKNYTIITVLNYEVYQKKDKEDNQDINQEITKEQPRTNQGLTTNKNDKKELIYTVFSHWNSKEIITHKQLSEKQSGHINAKLESGYTLEEILKAIDNYATVLKEDKYFWTYKWKLDEFLVRGLDQFIDKNEPLKNFQRNKGENSQKMPLPLDKPRIVRSVEDVSRPGK